MRNTKQCDLIYSIVFNSNKHLNAESIYKECLKYQSNISLGTVYRNLNKLVDLKKIRRLKMPNNIDRFDKNVPHSHTFCLKCGGVDDIFEECVETVPKFNNFIYIDYDLVFNGICEKCQKEER